ncbi:MAG: sulfotransferase [Planctomycetaceae bacterium]
MKKIPNFFVIGAPKCGTTALTEYLRQHPRVFISNPKEPRFWCSDLKNNPRAERWLVTTDNVNGYLKLFRTATADHLAVGEGTTLNLYSAAAVPRILEFNPQARFIVMVRNPVEMFHSWHSYLVRQFHEDVTCPEKAWSLQADRQQGRHIPQNCDIPEKLQYRKIIALGEQLERLLQTVPGERVRVVVYDDFAADPGTEYARTLDFLEVPHDGRTDFPRVNEAFTYRFPWLAKRLLSPPRPVLHAFRWLQTHLPAPMAVRLRHKTLSAMRTGAGKPRLPETLRNLIAREMRDDVVRLGELLNRDLAHWTRGADVSVSPVSAPFTDRQPS